MALLDPELAPMEAQDAAQVVEQLPHVEHRVDDPAPAYTPDEKHLQEKAGSLSSGTVDEIEEMRHQGSRSIRLASSFFRNQLRLVQSLQRRRQSR